MTTTPTGLLKVLAPLLLVLSLSGCFKSSTPLLDASNAQYPFTTLTLKNEDGQTSIVKRDGDVYRFIDDGKQDVTALLIHELGPDLYLVQVAPPTGEADYLFAKKLNGDLVVRSDCQGLDPAMLRGKGVEIEESGAIYECHFKDLNTLIELGKAPGLWESSTTTLNVISIE
jgi:hypothetical protein